jgi:uncharacterized protein YyaL (SSP411 family)
MEDETFRDPAVIETLQEHFVSIRIDRDDWPDIDRRMQNIFVRWHGRTEGWPLNVFLSPDLIPLYVETYLPTHSTAEQLGFDRVMELVERGYTTQRNKRLDQGRTIVQQLALPASIEATQIEPLYLKETFLRQVDAAYDPIHGGFVEVPKRLHLSTLETLLEIAERFDAAEPLDIVSETINRLYDSAMWSPEGGIWRRARTREWTEPFGGRYTRDAAVMIRVLLKLARLRKEQLYRQWAIALSDWLLSRIRLSDGVFAYGEFDAGIDRRMYAVVGAHVASALLRVATEEDRYRPDALGAVQTLMDRFVRGDMLIHRLDHENPSGYLEDYAAVAGALIDAWELTQNGAFHTGAVSLANEAIKRFYRGGFWRIGDGVFDDPSPWIDTDTPAPAASMIGVLARLSRTHDTIYTKFVRQTLAAASYDLMRKPLERATLVATALDQ